MLILGFAARVSNHGLVASLASRTRVQLQLASISYNPKVKRVSYLFLERDSGRRNARLTRTKANKRVCLTRLRY